MLRATSKVSSDPKVARRVNAIRDVLKTFEEDDLPPEKERGVKSLTEKIKRALRRRPPQLERADSLIIDLYALFTPEET